ncbi:MAG: hypothetical protein AB1649_16910, partial [Chloroflexota bacterium]
ALGLSKDQAKLTDSYYQARLASGYNRKWGAALAQDWALEAGSVFVLNANSLPNREALLADGIGLRRVEGYGRLAINWHTNPNPKRVPIQKPSESSQPVSLRPASRKLAEDMAQRLLRAHLDRRLVALVTEKQFTKDDFLPSPSQLNRVRVAARQVIFAKDAGPIANHVNGLKTARKDWEKSGLKEWVVNHSPMPEPDFRKAFQLQNEPPPIAGVTGELDSDLINEYSARLVDGVMKLAAEHARARREREQQ